MRISRFSDFGGQNRKSSAAAPERRTARDFFYSGKRTHDWNSPRGKHLAGACAYMRTRARACADYDTPPRGVPKTVP